MTRRTAAEWEGEEVTREEVRPFVESHYPDGLFWWTQRDPRTGVVTTHSRPAWEIFLEENGDHDVYDADSVLTWLGY